VEYHKGFGHGARFLYNCGEPGLKAIFRNAEWSNLSIRNSVKELPGRIITLLVSIETYTLQELS
jgi:hypothetical protein